MCLTVFCNQCHRMTSKARNVDGFVVSFNTTIVRERVLMCEKC